MQSALYKTLFLHLLLAAFSDVSLLDVNLRLVPHEQCFKCYSEKTFSADNQTFAETHFCVDDPRYEWNDSAGGPLLLHLKTLDELNWDYVVGLTTFSDGCGKNSPRLYTRLSVYSKWIFNVVFS